MATHALLAIKKDAHTKRKKTKQKPAHDLPAVTLAALFLAALCVRNTRKSRQWQIKAETKHLRLTESAAQCKTKAGHTDKFQHGDRNWWWGQTDVIPSVKPSSFKFDVTQRTNSEATQHDMEQQCRTPANRKQRVISSLRAIAGILCDFNAGYMWYLDDIWSHQWHRNPCNHTRVTTHAPFVSLWCEGIVWHFWKSSGLVFVW